MITGWATITTIIVIVGWIIPFVLLFIVPANRKPSSATAWLLLTFMPPYFGVLLFLLLGSPKLSRRRRTGQRTMDNLISRVVVEARKRPEQASLLDPPIAPRYEPFVKLNTNLGDLAASGGNTVELLPAQSGGHADVLRPAGGCEPPPDRGRLPVQVQTGEP